MNDDAKKENEVLIDCNMRLGYAYVPMQKAVMTNLFNPEYALERGTVFPLLDIPLGVYGFQFEKKEEGIK